MLIALKKNGKYVSQANAQIRVQTQGGIPVAKEIKLDTIEYEYTTDIREAKLIEDPDFDTIVRYGFEAIIVEVDNKQDIKEYQCINM